MVLQKSLDFIQDELNTYLTQRSDVGKVVLSNIMKQNGEVVVKEDQLAISLVNIEEESIGKTQKAYLEQENGSRVKTNPDIKLNLYLLFVARFGQYTMSLKAISHVVSFFQSRNVFKRSEFPAMDDSLDKLIFELQTMNFEQMNHLWGAVGAKYMPSVLYKMRMLTVKEDEIKGDVMPIKEIDIEGK